MTRPMIRETVIKATTHLMVKSRTLNINRASFSVLNRHPYISYEQAKALVGYMRLYGRIGDERVLMATGIFSADENFSPVKFKCFVFKVFCSKNMKLLQCLHFLKKEKVVLVLFRASEPLSLFFVYIGSIKLGSIILLSAFRGVLFVNVGYL